MAPRRSRKTVVFNTTASPLAFNAAGQLIFPGTSRAADPEDPITASYLAKGDLIIKEG